MPRAYVAYRCRQEYSQLLSMHSTKTLLTSYLDTFCRDLIAASGKKLPNFTVFIKKILILSHGNATLERGFSVNKECVVMNLEKDRLVAQRLVYDTVQVAWGGHEIVIDEEMRKLLK